MDHQTKNRPCTQDPLYQEVLSHYQEGEWENGVKKIEELLKKYSHDEELIEFKNEFNIRLAITEEEIQEELKEKKRNRTRKIFSYATIILLIAGISYGVYYLFTLIQETNAEIARAAAQNALESTIDKKITNAQSLLQAGKPEDALVIINEIRELAPDHSQLDTLTQDAQNQIDIEEKYAQAVDLLANQDYEKALGLLKEINNQVPTYKDVEYKIELIENILSVLQNISEGHTAYENKQWANAIDGYEAALDNFPTMDIGIDKEEIRNNLYESYVNHILEILNKEEISDQDVSKAVENYKNFLSMRPQDKDSIEQRKAIEESFTNVIVQHYISTANQYLLETENMEIAIQLADEIINQAISLKTPDENVVDFSENLDLYKNAVGSIKEKDWNAAIDSLQEIYEKDPNFAGGVVRLLLFEAYMELGNNSLFRGFYQDALGYYQLALSIANETSFLLPSLQARMEVALVLGKLGGYEEAANLYRAIINDFNIPQHLRRKGNADLQNRVSSADSNFFKGDFRSAYLDYVGLFDRIQLLYEYSQISIQTGDNLAGLAISHESTVQAIITENDMPYQIIVIEDRDINVPKFPNNN